MSAQDIHEAADALVDHAVDTFWRDDSAFHSSSRFSYEAAAAWLHEYAVGGVDDESVVHLFAPSEDHLSLCRDSEDHATTTDPNAVTCGRCRVKARAAAP